MRMTLLIYHTGSDGRNEIKDGKLKGKLKALTRKGRREFICFIICVDKQYYMAYSIIL